MILILNDIRSSQNVGAILRSSDAFGVDRVYCSGITPYPTMPDDKRLPHVAIKATNQIAKTALGAEKYLKIKHVNNVKTLINELRTDGFAILALEQSKTSAPLKSYKPDQKLALIVGNEVTGLSEELLKMVDHTLEIPMLGQKESLNVAVAAGIALYALSN